MGVMQEPVRRCLPDRGAQPMLQEASAPGEKAASLTLQAPMAAAQEDPWPRSVCAPVKTVTCRPSSTAASAESAASPWSAGDILPQDVWQAWCLAAGALILASPRRLPGSGVPDHPRHSRMGCSTTAMAASLCLITHTGRALRPLCPRQRWQRRPLPCTHAHSKVQGCPRGYASSLARPTRYAPRPAARPAAPALGLP